ncbi:MAG: tetratricopeptide repeat protein [Acidobacteria bacterium]|nr:tetratricopeptide repeat protein [Acidobacteriota bacterium]
MAGNEALSKKQYPEAEKTYLAAIAEAEKLEPQDSRLATCLMALGFLYYVEGKLLDAKNLHMRALLILEKVRGAQAPELMPVLEALSRDYLSLNQRKDAEMVMLRAAAIAGKDAERNPRVLNSALMNLARIYRANRKIEEAALTYDKVLKSQEESEGPGSSNIINTLLEIGLLQDSFVRDGNGEPYFQRALALAGSTAKGQSNQGGSIRMFDVMEKVGEHYKRFKKYEEAESIYRRLLAAHEVATPRDNNAVVNATIDVCVVYILQRKFEEAIPILRQALVLAEKSDPPNLATTTVVLSNLGNSLTAIGRYAESEEVWKRELAIEQTTPLPPRSTFPRAIHGLANLYTTVGRYPEAEAMYRQMLAMTEKASGSESPLNIGILSGYSSMLRKAGRTTEAAAMQDRAKALIEKNRTTTTP